MAMEEKNNSIVSQAATQSLLQDACITDFFNAVSRKSDIIPSLTEQSNGSKIVNAASSQMPTMTNNIVNAGDHGVGSTDHFLR